METDKSYITEGKQAEDSLREADARLTAVFEASPTDP